MPCRKFRRIVRFVGRREIVQNWLFEYKAVGVKKHNLLRMRMNGGDYRPTALARLREWQHRVNTRARAIDAHFAAERALFERRAKRWQLGNKLVARFTRDIYGNRMSDRPPAEFRAPHYHHAIFYGENGFRIEKVMATYSIGSEGQRLYDYHTKLPEVLDELDSNA